MANPELVDAGLGTFIVLGLALIAAMIPELLHERREAKIRRWIFEMCNPTYRRVRK